MNLLYEKTRGEDIEEIYELCKRLIHDYEQLDTIDYPKVMNWVRKKIEKSRDWFCNSKEMNFKKESCIMNDIE
ncbi:MAG: hypothetical protein ACI4AD_13755 [Roseburia sp.]